MMFYGVVYNTNGKSFTEWAYAFNKKNSDLRAEPRSNCVVIFRIH